MPCKSGRLDDAESFFATVIDAAPQFAEGWNKRATVRYMRKNFHGAIADCQETLARNPTSFWRGIRTGALPPVAATVS